MVEERKTVNLNMRSFEIDDSFEKNKKNNGRADKTGGGAQRNRYLPHNQSIKSSVSGI